MTLQCDLCVAEVDCVEVAIESGWAPSYWLDMDDDSETCSPICLHCATNKCDMIDGELVLKPKAIQPATISDYGRYLPPVNLFSR